METETPNSGWQGHTRSDVESQHRWASDWNELQKREFTAHPNRIRRRVLLFLLFVIGLSCVFIYAVSFYPKRTPMATIVLTGYDAPLPPNAGAFDDLETIRSLHDKNLRVEDISSSWQNKQAGLNRLDQFFQSLLKKNKQDDAIIVYINGYGAVNDLGEPCLLLPGYEPRQTEHWLRMKILLERIRSTVKGRVPVALVVDCVKLRRNWRMGILVNQWQERLRDVVDDLAFENLIVLSSAGPNQINEYSSTLKSTVFGHFLQLGLAGHADRVFDTELNLGGNNDGTVSAAELEVYLRLKVGEWTRINRADVQLPELLNYGNQDFPLVSSLNRRAVKRLESLPDTQKPSAVSLADVTNLWKTLDGFRTAVRMREQPALVHKTENSLVRLEQLLNAGTGFDDKAVELAKTIQTELERESKNESTPSSAYLSNVMGNDNRPFGSVYSNRYFGRISADDVERMTETFLNVSGSQQSENYLIGERLGKPQPLESFLGRWLNELNRSGVWSSTEPSSRFAKLHIDSEAASWPKDIRTLRWAAKDLQDADRARRLAFDSLFVGDKKAFEDSFQVANQIYSAQLKEGNSPLRTVAQCLQLRDQAVAEYVVLAEWHTRWESPFSKGKKDERQAILSRKKTRFSNLSALLDDFSNELSQTNLSINAADLLDSYRQIRKEFDSIRDEFLNACEGLVNVSSLDGSLVFRIKAALRSPIIPWETREKLINKLIETKIKIAADQSEKGPSSDESSQQNDRIANAVDQLIGESELQNDLTNQPFLSFLKIKTSDSLVDVGAATRELLNNAADRKFLLRLANEEAIDIDEMEMDGCRSALASMATWGRKLFSVVNVESDFNPIHDYLKFELQQSLLWHVNRAIGDFFGAMPDSNLAEIRPMPLFSVVATPLLDQAQEVSSVHRFSANQLAQLRSRLAECVEECDAMIKVAVRSEPNLNDGDSIKLRVDLKSKRDPLPNVDNHRDGMISVRMQSRRSSRWGPGFAVDYPVPSNGFSKLWSVNDQMGTQLTSFYRGHEFQTPVFMRNIGGHRVELFPQKKPNATITLVGSRKGRSSIVFILDCSQSMAKEIQAELIGDKQVARLSLAKNSLVTMLDELAQRKDARVGVRLFGHRTGWSTSNPSIRMRQKTYDGTIPELLIPENDVEQMLPLGRFTEIESNEVASRLRSVIPWGQSPLNLAIKQALNDFEREDADTQKSIVVITDGLNYQFSPSSESLNIPKITSLKDVSNELEKTKVPVFILGFGISADEKQEAEQEFFSIAEKSGGSYFAIESGQELLETLRAQLQLGQYQILNASQDPVESNGEEFAKLNDETKLSVAGDFKVVFDTIELDVVTEGQEALKFRLLEKESKITAIPYNVLDPTTAFLQHDDESGKIALRAHRPSNFESGFVFPISIQFQDRAFTPRPRDIWVEIRPRTSSNERIQGGQPNGANDGLEELAVQQKNLTRKFPFVFFDRDFADGTPVPLKRCVVPNWPANSNTAEISVFCKFAETKPLTSIPLKQWADTKQTEWQEVDGFQGVRYKVTLEESSDGTVFIRVFEEHQESSAGLYSFRVDIGAANSNGPIRITRQFDSENMMAVNTFQFKQADYADLISEKVSATIDFTSKDSLRSGAWKMTESSLDVRLFEEIGLLPIEAATGQR